MSPAAIAACAALGVAGLGCLVFMRRVITYVIASDRLEIRVFGLPAMTIPYDDIAEVRVGRWFLSRFREIQFTNALGPLCQIEKTSGTFRYVLISPEDPQAIVDAVAAYRTRTIP